MLKAPASHHPPTDPQADGGLNWWVFLWASVVFIIYGSLFPFNFQSEARPIEEFYAAWHMFRNIPDASDNILLFIPLGIGLDACFRGRNRRLLASTVAWLALGVGIQLIQLYLPSRTAAVSDALWNAVGMLFGVLAFKRVRLMVDQLKRSSTGSQDSFAMLLVLLWFCYESFPFVPTLDVGLLRDHIKSVVIAPPFELMRLLQHTLAAVLAGLLMVRSNWLQPRWLNVLIPGVLAFVLEIVVAYGSLRRETLLGLCGGLFLGYWLASRKPQKIPVFAVNVALCALLITVLTPFRGQAPGSTFTFTPFADIFWKGVTVDVSPSAFEALSIGILLWSGRQFKSMVHISRVHWVGAGVVLLLVMEAFRMYVVGYRGDTTPLVTMLILASFLNPFRGELAVAPQPVTVLPRQDAAVLVRTPVTSPAQAHVISIMALALLLGLLFHLPGLPYNVRALLGPGIGGIISALAVAFTAYGMANGVFLLLDSRRRKWLMLFPAGLLIHGVLTWWVLRYSVPSKSLLDIVGTPSLGWPGDWELIGRYVALHFAVMLQIVGAVLLVRTVLQASSLADFIFWVLVSMVMALPLYWVVVSCAVTDNLTELMAGDASFLAATALALALFLTCLGGSALSASISAGKYFWRLLVLASLALVGATCLFWLGTEHSIVKYGKVFSAFQFLLSTDRQNYAQGIALASRYVAALCLFCISLAVMQWPSWSWLLRTLPHREMRLT